MTSYGLLALLAGASLGSAVACVGSPPALERYRLTPSPQAAAPAAPASSDRASPLVVEPYATSGIYADPQIVYRLGEVTYGSYPNREWALPLGSMLADATIESLRAAPGLDVQVSDDRILRSPRLVWRGVVQQFEEVNRGDQVSAAVRLDAALVRVPGDSVVWQGTAGLERPVPDPTMSAVVTTLSQLSTQVIRQLVGQAGLTTGEVRTANSAAPR